MWAARIIRPGFRREAAIGPADDAFDADGLTALSYSQAQEKARAWFTDEDRKAAGLGPATSGPYTVANTMTDYLAWYGRHRKAVAATTHASKAHIVPALGSKPADKLTPRLLQDWLSKLADAPPRRRRSSRPTPAAKAKAKSALPLTNPEEKRKRRATANRVLTVLKAALNHAWREGKVASDDAWRRVKPFRDVDVPVIRYLSEAECVRLVNGCPVDFRPMVRAALLTGCRYGELVALHVSDFNADAGTLSVRTSKSGKPRHVVLTDEGREFFTDATAGKTGIDPMFARPDGDLWNKNHQQRRLALACKRAGIKPAVSFHVLRHTHGSTLAMRGVPLPVIAKQLGHSDTRMTERHYAHLGPSYLADTIRAGFPTLGILDTRSVTPLTRRPKKPHR